MDKRGSSKTAAPAGLKKIDIELPLEQSRRFKAKLIFNALGLAALAGLFVWVSVELHRNDPVAWEAEGPKGGYYFAAAKYQVGFTKLRLELSLASKGTAVWPEDIRARARELGEMLNELQKAKDGEQLPGFREAVRRLTVFQQKLNAKLAKSEVSKDDVLLTLIELESMDSTLSSMVERVGDEERARRAAAMAGLSARRELLWKVLGACWLVTILWLAHAWRSKGLQAAASRERKRALEAERQAVAAKEEALHAKEQAVHERSRFLASISHELRSSLQSIRSALDVLQQEPGHKDRVLIGRIQRATDSLVAQLRDLLTIARGEAGKLEMHPAPFEAGEFVLDVVDEFRAAAIAKGLSFIVDLPKEPVYVVADYTRIGQVLNNLVSNAVKYTVRGSVRVAMEGLDATGQKLLVSVRDTGPGIPPQLVGRIWEQYQRLGHVDRTSESAGIGLSVVKTLATTLGASVTVNSVVGKGTEFAVEIPVEPQRNEETAVVDAGSTRLLIVDDRQEILEGLAEVARGLDGVSVVTAQSAALAANLLGAKTFDLVLIDMDMPDKNGVTLAYETRRGHGPNQETRLVAISAADGRAVGSGYPFNEFLQKPIDRRALQRLVEAGRGSGHMLQSVAA
jgi:signal transduction histidine kinase